jgi:hypothetical protein
MGRARRSASASRRRRDARPGVPNQISRICHLAVEIPQAAMGVNKHATCRGGRLFGTARTRRPTKMMRQWVGRVVPPLPVGDGATRAPARRVRINKLVANGVTFQKSREIFRHREDTTPYLINWSNTNHGRAP